MSLRRYIPSLLSGRYLNRWVTRSYSLSSQGFSLIEVLVSLVLVSISVLGTLSVQTRVAQQNLHAYSRSQAVSLAYDMAERMRLNTQAVIDGSYTLNLKADPVAGSSIASQDLSGWINSVSTLLPEGDGAISVDAVNRRASITICWTKDRNNSCSESYLLRILL